MVGFPILRKEIENSIGRKVLGLPSIFLVQICQCLADCVAEIGKNVPNKGAYQRRGRTVIRWLQ